MKIAGCETIPVRVNFEGVMPGTHIVLRLRTDEGLEGISYISRAHLGKLAPHAQRPAGGACRTHPGRARPQLPGDQVPAGG